MSTEFGGKRSFILRTPHSLLRTSKRKEFFTCPELKVEVNQDSDARK